MPSFRTRLVPGGKVPYDSWTFVVLPPEVARTLALRGSTAVCGTIGTLEFRGTVSKGEGAYRMPVTRDWLAQAGLVRGDLVNVLLELDTKPRPVAIPEELQALFGDDRDLAALFEGLPPAHRRAWAAYVDEAKRPETRLRRAKKAPDGIRRRAFPGA